MFAEDVDLLPNKMFQGACLKHAATRPNEFQALAQDLFKAMQSGGRVGFEQVAWFNGGLFKTTTAPCRWIAMTLRLRCTRRGLTGRKSIRPFWEPSSSAGLDPGKRSQLGAHYTDREKIMRIIEPVIMQPWLEGMGEH